MQHDESSHKKVQHEKIKHECNMKGVKKKGKTKANERWKNSDILKMCNTKKVENEK